MLDYSERALKRISPIYENSAFIREIFKACGSYYDLIREYLMTLREQSFNSTVDWAIKYREDMYSLDHPTDLTLDERRARLFIRSQTHYPLNPATIERVLADNFKLNTYIAEFRDGFIDLFYDLATPDTIRRAINWLMAEKPAHLMLETTWIDDNKQEINVGIAQVTAGNIIIEPVRPHNHLGKIRAGVANFIYGDMTIEPVKPRDRYIEVYAGCPVIIHGEINIGAEDNPSTAQIYETPIADLAVAAGSVAR